MRFSRVWAIFWGVVAVVLLLTHGGGEDRET
jgi:hypothetical protein